MAEHSEFSCGIPDRFPKVLPCLERHHVDGVLLSYEPNVTYCAGFSAPDSYLLIDHQGMLLVTDFRYAADFARKAPASLRVREYRGGLFKDLVGVMQLRRLKRVGFESRHMPFAECQKLYELAGKKVEFIPLESTVEPIRAIKEAGELELIRKALGIARSAYIFIKPFLKSGITEKKVAAELERFIRLQGANKSAFDTIVASGPNGSYPHAVVSDRRLSNGEAVTIDMGVDVGGYKCDLTRTFFLGKINPSVRRAFRVLQQAQEQAIKCIRPGVVCAAVDRAARQFITQRGFGKNFGHALGHGVGLEVHEAPSINKRNKTVLERGMVFTVEPGIYCAGRFGIRVEDMVLVTNNGVEVLSGDTSD